MNFFDRYTQSRNAAIYAWLHAQNAKAVSPTAVASGAGGSNSGSKPTPSEPVAYDMTWYLIHDKTTWEEAYNAEESPLKRYYEAHPEEDLWNVDEQRAVNFNDRWYTGTIDGEEVSCGTTWADDGVQKITVDGVEYYFEIWSYGLDPKNVALFKNVKMTESADKTFEIATVVFDPEKCKHCWEGTINAPGAKLPWTAVDVKSPYDLSKNEGKIEFQYDGENYYPFGDEFGKFRGYGIVSIPSLISSIPTIDAQHTDTIDKSELTVKGYVKLA